jgi:hypothetical protein
MVVFYDQLKIKEFDHFPKELRGNCCYSIVFFFTISDLRREFPTEEGERHFWNAKYVTATFDASPDCLSQATRILKMDGGVIRVHTLKLKSLQQAIKQNNYKNPFFQPSRPSNQSVTK